MINVIIRESEGVSREQTIKSVGELKASKLKEYLAEKDNKYKEFELFCDGVKVEKNASLETLNGIVEFKKERKVELSSDSEEEDKYPLYLKAFNILKGTLDNIDFDEDEITKRMKECFFKEDTPVIKNTSLGADSLFESIRKQLHLIEPENFKMNLVLDIDSTFLFAKSFIPDDNKYEPFQMRIEDQGTVFNLNYMFRPGLKEFLQEISPYFYIHLNTHGTLEYCKQVKQNLEEHFGVSVVNWYGLPKQYRNEKPPEKSLKQLDFTPEMEESTLILDDKFEAWEIQYQSIIIPSKAFFGFTGKLFKPRKEEEVPRIMRIPLGQFNKIESFQFKKGEIDDLNELPFNCEYEFSKTKQLSFVGRAFLNVHKLFSRGMHTTEALENIRRAVLKGINVKVNLIRNPQLKDLCGLIAFHLGSTENGLEICLINENEVSNWPKNCLLVKSKWLLDCFYFLRRIPFRDFQVKPR